MSTIYTRTDAEGDTLSVLPYGDSILVMWGQDESKTVELPALEVATLAAVLSAWVARHIRSGA